MLASWRKPDCPHCGGTGWKTVERIAEDEKPKRVSWEKPVADTGEKRRVWAVPCDCTAATAPRERWLARVSHGATSIATFDNFDTDLYEATGESAAWNRSLDNPSSSSKRLLATIRSGQRQACY